MSMASAPSLSRARALLAVHLVLALFSFSRATGGLSDNWAVIITSSRYWLNYRHSSNALGVYQAIKRLGIPDSHILLMLAEQPGCSPRNVHPGQLYLAPGVGAAGGTSSSSSSSSDGGVLNLLGSDAEVDYRGREVSVDSVLRVLTGRHPAGTPASKRLLSGPRSRVLLYLTGHGGDEFLKFHDEEELLATDIAAAVHQMAAAGRYGELLLLADTCQASTLYSRIAAATPNVLALASSKLGQSSYAHHVDHVVGQHVVDQLSFHLHEFLWHLPPHLSTTTAAVSGGGGGAGAGGAAAGPSLQQMLDYISGQRLSSEVQMQADLSPRHPAHIPVTDFFGAAARQPATSTNASASASSHRAAAAVMQLARQQERAAREEEVELLPATVQQPSQPLFELLEAAGGGSAEHRLAVEAAAVVAVWAATVVLSRLLLQP